MTYNRTKGINKSKLTVALVAMTLVFSLLLIILLPFHYDISRNIKYSGVSKNASKVVAAMEEYMDNRDYRGLTIYLYANDIRFSYNSKLYNYNCVKAAADNMVTLISEMTKLTFDYDYRINDYTPGNVSNCIRYIYNGSKNYSDLSASQQKFLDNAIKDMEAVLHTYLNVSEAELVELPSMSDATRAAFVEKKMEEIVNER